MQFVHEACLLRWIEEKQLTNRFEPLRCPQCNTRLILTELNRPWLVTIGDAYLDTTSELAPFAGIVGLAGVCWAGLACYGAAAFSTATGISVRQLVQTYNPLVLVAVLPLVPCSLVATRMFSRLSFEITVDTQGVWRLNVRDGATITVIQPDLDDDEANVELEDGQLEELGLEDQEDLQDDWEDVEAGGKCVCKVTVCRLPACLGQCLVPTLLVLTPCYM
jgi:hypothetical protein